MSPDTRHRTHSRSDNAAVVLYIPESVIRVRVVVEGRVQGVFYRQGCQRVAVSNRLTGWVRNNRGGSVEAVLEGEPDAVDRVVALMRVGPPQAFVTSVVTTEETPQNFGAFTVR